MRLVKLIMLNKSELFIIRLAAVIFFIASVLPASKAQDNSPYSRYGLGDKTPTGNVISRSMGGINAAHNDYYDVNYNNPASYAYYEANQELKSKKLNSGRAILNIAVNNDNRIIVDSKTKTKFNASNLLFSNVMLGVPLRKNWGMAFGIRQLHNIDYKILDSNKIVNDANKLLIDKGQTLFEGNGGLYLPTIGTGFKFKLAKSQFLSFGFNGGYTFGKKDYATRRSLANDSTAYSSAFHQTSTTMGGAYLDAGMQYHFKLSKKVYMGVGAYGNVKQKLNTKKNYTTGTYIYNENVGYQPIDTVAFNKNVNGTITYPSGFTLGFIIQKPQETIKDAGWLFGMDFTRNNWDDFRVDGVKDNLIKSDWQLKMGAEFHPIRKNSYFSNVAYRVGFHTGPDYVYPKKELPSYGLSFGMGLPVANYSPQAKYQRTLINLALEYVKRGNDKNILKENLYRISVGFSLTDLWFGKRRYD